MTTRHTSPPSSRWRRLLRSIVLGVAVAAVVTALAFLIRSKWDPLLHADEAAIRAATDVTRAHPTLRTSLIAWQEFTQPLNGYVIATAVCLWVWLGRGLRTRAWWAFATMMVGWNIALVLKYLVARARPEVVDPVSHSPGYSFPSGHAANATIVSMALVVLLWPLLGRTGRVVAVAAAAVWTVVTCLDRVFLGVHFPSDVIGGVLLGAGLVGASYFGYRGWRPPESGVRPDGGDHHTGRPATTHTPARDTRRSAGR